MTALALLFEYSTLMNIQIKKAPMYQRSAQEVILLYAKSFPAVVITGPRQSGKTTVARFLFPHLPYVLFEDHDTRERAEKDPRGFLAQYQEGAIFDEVQYVPHIISYLQGVLDSSRAKGRFILTGSQNFVLSEHITQSLAGRAGMVTLLPLSAKELNNPDMSHAQLILSGGYPALHSDAIPAKVFYPSYISTYLERDVRQLKNIGSLSLFRTFLKLCAGRVGQLLNIASIAKDCGIAPSTAREWLTVLEASYIIFLLPPYHTNFGKRSIKMPKLYFYDTGVVSSLLEIHSEEQLNYHYLRGGLFENLVVLEFLKARLNRGLAPSMYFFRDSNQKEVDIVGEWGGPLKAIEIKASQTMNSDDMKNLIYFKKLASDTCSYMVYAAPQSGLYNGTQLLSLSAIDGLFD